MYLLPLLVYLIKLSHWTYLVEMEVHVNKEVDKQEDPRNLEKKKGVTFLVYFS